MSNYTICVYHCGLYGICSSEKVRKKTKYIFAVTDTVAIIDTAAVIVVVSVLSFSIVILEKQRLSKIVICFIFERLVEIGDMPGCSKTYLLKTVYQVLRFERILILP